MVLVKIFFLPADKFQIYTYAFANTQITTSSTSQTQIRLAIPDCTPESRNTSSSSSKSSQLSPQLHFILQQRLPLTVFH